MSVSQTRSDGLADFAVAVVEDDLAAVPFRRDLLHGRCVRWHDDDARDAEDLPGERDGLRVIAGRERDDTATALIGREA